MLLLIEHQLQLSDEKQVKKQQQTRLHLKEIIATGDIELAKMRLNWKGRLLGDARPRVVLQWECARTLSQILGITWSGKFVFLSEFFRQKILVSSNSKSIAFETSSKSLSSQQHKLSDCDCEFNIRFFLMADTHCLKLILHFLISFVPLSAYLWF